MKTIVIDQEKCVDCGNCEALLPGLVHQMKGNLPLSDTKYENEKDTIKKAIEHCYLDCITIVPNMVYVYKCSKCKNISENNGNGAPAGYCAECKEQLLKRIS